MHLRSSLCSHISEPPALELLEEGELPTSGSQEPEGEGPPSLLQLVPAPEPLPVSLPISEQEGEVR